MKASVVIGLILLWLCISAQAQAPQGINYQGVARDLEGQPLSQKEISVRISILNGSADGEVEYDEIHEIRTNSFGLFSLVIGKGLPGTGSFNFIGWTSGNKWLQVELDENGGRNFKLMGSQQFMSVPYALYAERSGNGYQAGQGINIENNMISNSGDGDDNATNELIADVTFGADNKLRITDAGGTKEADLSGLMGAGQNLSGVLTQGNSAGNNTITNLGAPLNPSDATTKAYVDAHTDGDASSTNELQSLSQVLSVGNDAGATRITNVGSPTQNADAATKQYVDNLDATDNDKSITNEIQTLSKTGSTVSLSTGGGSIVLNDDSPTNEIQNISTASVDANTRSLSITGGSTINVDVRDADASVTNEAQTLSRTGSSISLTQVSGAGGGMVSVDDADANSINEAQTLTKSGATISLTNVSGVGGGSVILNDDSNTNEAQSISRTGSTVTMTQANGAGGGSFSIDDADASSTNEAQTLSRTGSNILLTQISGVGGGTVSVDDADASATNEAQTLSRTGSNITLTQISGVGGGTVSVDDADATPTNEAQTISRIGNTVTLTNVSGVGGGTFTVDPDATNEIQNLNQVLTTGSNGGGNAITNIANPTNPQDATTKNYVDAADALINARISTTYAFKTEFSFANLSGSEIDDQQIPFTILEFDSFGVLGGNSFTANEDGIYVFIVEGTGNITIGGTIQLSILFNGNKYPIPIPLPAAGSVRYASSMIFSMTNGQTISLVGDNIPNLNSFTGRFSGFKL